VKEEISRFGEPTAANIFANQLAGTRWNGLARRRAEECILGPKTFTNWHSIKQGGMAAHNFQDRCLKPLGHPSEPMTSDS
jgi:hypothetical protein